jgi:hypothetical protein
MWTAVAHGKLLENINIPAKESLCYYELKQNNHGLMKNAERY